MLGRALAQVVNVVDPHVIVLGGGLSQCAFVYQGLTDALAGFVFSPRVTTPVVAAAHGDDSGVRGAAWL